MVVLASASPRRRELLAAICPVFRVVPAGVDETLDPGPYPAAAAALALRKARAVAAGLAEGLVLGADTLVVIDGEALGKPADAGEAGRMLARLRGRVHDVITGLGVVDARTGRARSASVESRVLMADYPDELIEDYVASGSPLDKAGGYAVQDLDGGLVDGLVGSYTNVVGLPLGAAAELLRAFGVPVSDDAVRRGIAHGAPGRGD